MATGADRFYQLSSGVGHGMVWSTEILASVEAVFSGLADSLATAVNMTECAIALFEAQAQSPTGPTSWKCHYPARLEPAIKEWAGMYRP